MELRTDYTNGEKFSATDINSITKEINGINDKLVSCAYEPLTEEEINEATKEINEATDNK